MSNYIYGFMKLDGRDAADCAKVIAKISDKSVTGFHKIESDMIPKVEHLPELTGYTCFCLSDGSRTLLSSYLIFEMDWSDSPVNDLPKELVRRIALLVEQVTIIFREANCSTVNIWISENDQIEEVVAIPLSSFADTVSEDFLSRGIPCKLYEIHS